jgi:hypothetical protein
VLVLVLVVVLGSCRIDHDDEDEDEHDWENVRNSPTINPAGSAGVPLHGSRRRERSGGSN